MGGVGSFMSFMALVVVHIVIVCVFRIVMEDSVIKQIMNVVTKYNLDFFCHYFIAQFHNKQHSQSIFLRKIEYHRHYQITLMFGFNLVYNMIHTYIHFFFFFLYLLFILTKY